MTTFRSNSEKETMDIGYKLGTLIKKGDIVCLEGQLGTGKTAFTKGVAQALGIAEHITSPTFTIVNEYMGRVPLYHFDVYRIPDPDELFEIGFDEYLDGRGIIIIEWANLIKEILPSDYITVKIEKCPNCDLNTRNITIDCNGEKYKNIIKAARFQELE